MNRDHSHSPTRGTPGRNGPSASPAPSAATDREPWRPEHIAPAYPVPYGPTTVAEIIPLLERLRSHVDAHTPPRIVDRRTGREINDFEPINPDADVAPGSFRLICYEQGVTCTGMLHAGEVTDDGRFTDYVTTRLQFLVDLVPYFQRLPAENGHRPHAFAAILRPRNLDDAGSMCAAMIKAHRAGLVQNLRPIIENYIDYIMHGQFRLGDGTLARNRPLPCSLWLDDLYMSVPALAQMALLTGDARYFDEAVRQVLQYAGRMFNEREGLYCHGWIEGMAFHPEFRWARANGWALLAKLELLEVLPASHRGREEILDLLRRHMRALLTRQSGQGLWNQLLDRPDSYLETSASAIFVYALARAINRGWIDPLAHGPATQLGWNALAARVDEAGQVHGTCVGTGMALDPMFYYCRPTSPFAAHGYGPTLLAGAEMIRLTMSGRATLHDSAVHFGVSEEDP